MNAWKHGERSAEAVATRAMFAGCLRVLRADTGALDEWMGYQSQRLDQ